MSTISIWYLRNLLLLATTDDAENLLDMSEDNIRLMKEEAGLQDPETLMRYIRVFSELSNQIRYGSQKRVLVELAFIKLTKPAMEHNFDSILQRIQDIGGQAGGWKLCAPGGCCGRRHAGWGGHLSPGCRAECGPESRSGRRPGRSPGSRTCRIFPGRCSAPQAGGAAAGTAGGSQCDPQRVGQNYPGGGRIRPLQLPQYCGGARRRELPVCGVHIPGGLCHRQSPHSPGEIERHVEAAFGKKIYFKARLAGAGERFDTIYVSKKELEEKIHMDIQEEDF